MSTDQLIYLVIGGVGLGVFVAACASWFQRDPGPPQATASDKEPDEQPPPPQPPKPPDPPDPATQRRTAARRQRAMKAKKPGRGLRLRATTDD
ncbi:hypothetical protein EV192_107484 [Actinocrispum wychmicini]|uniref:Uncharacterized protein n=1 Tax=Actinocrispum wychmicini TaxID=1213861 RepID=A0A4R2JI16_9PSEU|nr:hypothetical protein EV192_107484 [Actinocrispum wychmicini]